MSWITSLWHIALKSAEFDCIYNPSFGICHIQCYMHYNPLLFWGMLYMRVISHHTWIVTTHPDSLVKVERWMVHSTFFLNLPWDMPWWVVEGEWRGPGTAGLAGPPWKLLMTQWQLVILRSSQSESNGSRWPCGHRSEGAEPQPPPSWSVFSYKHHTEVQNIKVGLAWQCLQGPTLKND